MARNFGTQRNAVAQPRLAARDTNHDGQGRSSERLKRHEGLTNVTGISLIATIVVVGVIASFCYFFLR